MFEGGDKQQLLDHCCMRRCITTTVTVKQENGMPIVSLKTEKRALCYKSNDRSDVKGARKEMTMDGVEGNSSSEVRTGSNTVLHSRMYNGRALMQTM